jgi:hypothetical protein
MLEFIAILLFTFVEHELHHVKHVIYERPCPFSERSLFIFMACFFHELKKISSLISTVKLKFLCSLLLHEQSRQQTDTESLSFAEENIN